VAHIGGRHVNLDFHDPERVPLIEVHSHHGTFEWFLEEAMRRGLKVEFVGNSDDHTCRPGLTLTSDRFTTRGGYTGIYAKELTQEGLWEALWSRRCYATTGERMILDVDVGGHAMGEEYEGKKPPMIKVEIHGTAPSTRSRLRGARRPSTGTPSPRLERVRSVSSRWSGVASGSGAGLRGQTGRVASTSTRVVSSLSRSLPSTRKR
jgi:hypothetical protein